MPNNQQQASNRKKSDSQGEASGRGGTKSGSRRERKQGEREGRLSQLYDDVQHGRTRRISLPAS